PNHEAVLLDTDARLLEQVVAKLGHLTPQGADLVDQRLLRVTRVTLELRGLAHRASIVGASPTAAVDASSPAMLITRARCGRSAGNSIPNRGCPPTRTCAKSPGFTKATRGCWSVRTCSCHSAHGRTDARTAASPHEFSVAMRFTVDRESVVSINGNPTSRKSRSPTFTGSRRAISNDSSMPAPAT